MAQQQARDNSNLFPTRYTEQRASQFVGGAVDPTSGNIVPASRADIAQGQELPPAPTSTPTPATPTTRLGDISAPPAPSASSGLGSAIGSIATSVGSNLLGKQIAGAFGGGSGASSSSGGVSSGAGPMTGSSDDNRSNSALNPITASGGSGMPAEWGVGGQPVPQAPDVTFGSPSSVPYTDTSSPVGAAATPAASPSSSWNVYQASYQPPPSYGGGGGGGGGDDGGGSVVCTHFHDRGALPTRLYRLGAVYVSRHVRPQTMRGYQAWAIPLVRRMRAKGGDAEQRWLWVTRHVFHHFAYRLGKRRHDDVIGRSLFLVLASFSWCVGIFANEQDWRSLYANA